MLINISLVTYPLKVGFRFYNEMYRIQFLLGFKQARSISLLPQGKKKHQCLISWFYFALFLVHRYQYYLQVKKDVLDGRLRSSLEQGIRLAALAVQGILFLFFSFKKVFFRSSETCGHPFLVPAWCLFLDVISPNNPNLSTGLGQFCSLPKGSQCFNTVPLGRTW